MTDNNPQTETVAQADDTVAVGEENFSFVEAEHAVLDFWQRERIFERSLTQTGQGEPYIFYDGPPFATGLPHHGHLVASTIKDVVPRYFTMQGRHVQRRFGWDCHGLPIEHEIDKNLGMSSQEAVARLGVKGYNDECRKIVQRFTAQWEKTITRIGRWVDFRNDYRTMDPWYMESVWWVVKQLWEKGLLYEGLKVVPFSTALGTVLSNFEAGSNYKDVQDPAITVLFPLQDEADTCIAAWTTTPWTLPSNLALCVGDDIDYVKVHDAGRDLHIILAEARLEAMQKSLAARQGGTASLQVVARMKGRDLTGRRYRPLFDYFADMQNEGAFVIVADDYVSTDSGTGIVHQAPAFGEDDFRVLKAHGIEAMACPLDMQGRFTEEVADFAGQHVKEADKHIIRHLKDSGALYIQDVLVHNYPFCPRSDTPLIYRTVPSWYVRVEPMRDALLASNDSIRWVPEHMQQGRMGNWLKNAVDWSISRNRYWGTPLPLWRNDVSGKVHCIGSRQELQQLTGVAVEDLHREFVDELTFTIEGEPGTWRRVEEVLDCWFESGSMPYAQLHYPFENQNLFERSFPAEFIAEGLDQTRGWFYSLIVLGTALYDTAPIRNIIVNGIVLAEDGQKMSKRLRNYTAPDSLMETYGADALRLYLINSGLVRAEEQRFTDNGVKDMVRRALLPWLNAFRFLKIYADIDGWQPTADAGRSDNIMDQWILSRLQTLKARINTEMDGYRLYNVVPALFDFIEDLTNLYIRLNRSRFWGSGMVADKAHAYTTLYQTLRELTISMAPFAPFLAEHIYRELHVFADDPDAPISVHLCRYPQADTALIQAPLEEAVGRMQNIILLGRQKRNQVKIKTKVPLARLTIIHQQQSLLDEIARLQGYIRTELNVKEIAYSTDEAAFINLYAKPNAPVLGKRLGKTFRNYKARIEALDADTLRQLQGSGSLTLDGETFTTEDILLYREPRQGTETLSDRHISIDLDTTLDQSLIDEGLAREVVNRIQRSRKEMSLHVADRIRIRARAGDQLRRAMHDHLEYIRTETLATAFDFDEVEDGLAFDVDGHDLRLQIERIADE